jgi:TRAP transporter TAXI family solute receptor
MRRTILAAVAGTLAVVAGLTVLGFWFERPTVVRVAVTRDSDEHRLLIAAQQVFSRDKDGIRLRIVPQERISAASNLLESGDADFAVVRSDIAMPRSGQTAIILSRDAAVLLAPAHSDLTSSVNLAGKHVGVVWRRPGSTGNVRLLETILGRYGWGPEATTTIPLTAAEVGQAMTEGRIDAVLVVGALDSDQVTQTVAAVSAAGDGNAVFLPIPDAKAMAQRSPLYDAMEIPRGAFGGATPRPDHDVDTIGVTTRLVARSSLSDSTAGAVTRLLLSKRLSIGANAPVASRMEAPSTDRDAALPVHPGAAAWLDGEEESFLEKYSDFIYIGAMVLSVLASAAAALASRLNASGHSRIDDMMARLMTMLGEARRAASDEDLDALEEEADAILIEALQHPMRPSLDSQRATAFTLALDQVRHAVSDRRRYLLSAALALPMTQTRLLTRELPPT